MKKILLSLTSIIFAGAILAGSTGAFLANSSKSTGNTFASGVVELKIDNESYVTDNWGHLVFSTSTSWTLAPLAGHLFFNFGDVKPGDIGEDTISLHVNNNNVWACMNILLTGTPENGQTEPEKLVDLTSGTNQGELQNYLYFVFWADDGDNVYEKGEKIFKQGLVKDIWDGKNWVLADSGTNIWNGSGPLLGDTTEYIGKAWCFGDMTANPVTQDGKGKLGTNGPLVRGTGFTCVGVNVGNAVQSDGITADVTFSAVQSRDNSGFQCNPNNGGGTQYCSPGYWKQEQHFDSYVKYHSYDLFDVMFADNAFPGKTLVQVLSTGGGGLNMLGRAAVGALLNSMSMNTGFTNWDVINIFNAALASGDYNGAAAQLTAPENCPLN